MLLSDLQALKDTYQNIYEETDYISYEMIEEVVEELVEECLEFGYTVDELSEIIEEAVENYLDEATVTMGRGSELAARSRKERMDAAAAEKRSAARKAAVKTAVGKVKAKAAGAAAGASIAASIAKDEARRAGRAAAHTVTKTVQKKKAEVKSGVKKMIGRGLRKAAGAVGKVAQKAAGAASRLGEEYVDEALTGERYKKVMNKPGGTAYSRKVSADPSKRATRGGRGGESDFGAGDRGSGNKAARRAGTYQEEIQVDTWDVVLEYLITNGHADTNAEALYIMSQMDEEAIKGILETR